MAQTRTKPTNVIQINTDARCILCGNAGATQSRFCLECNGNSMNIEKPRAHEFRDEKGRDIDYLMSSELAHIANCLIRTYDEDFGRLEDAEIDYFWRREGGVSKGQSVLGKCIKVSAETRYYSQKDFMVWLAADNCFSFDYYKLTATVFHELKHAHFNIAKQTPEILGHDFEGFAREIEIFGAWRNNAVMMQNAFEKAVQPKLFK